MNQLKLTLTIGAKKGTKCWYMTKDIFLNRLNDNHIPSLTGRMGRGVTIVSTNILSLTGQMTTRFLTTACNNINS